MHPGIHDAAKSSNLGQSLKPRSLFIQKQYVIYAIPGEMFGQKYWDAANSKTLFGREVVEFPFQIMHKGPLCEGGRGEW